MLQECCEGRHLCNEEVGRAWPADWLGKSNLVLASPFTDRDNISLLSSPIPDRGNDFLSRCATTVFCSCIRSLPHGVVRYALLCSYDAVAALNTAQTHTSPPKHRFNVFAPLFSLQRLRRRHFVGAQNTLCWSFDTIWEKLVLLPSTSRDAPLRPLLADCLQHRVFPSPPILARRL
jgi:hypothetical protein